MPQIEAEVNANLRVQQSPPNSELSSGWAGHYSMKYWLHLIILLSLSGALIACTHRSESSVNTSPMPNIDIQRYMGTWYELARFPNKFERGLDRVMANYSQQNNGRIAIRNSGFDEQGEFTYVNGRGYIPNPVVAGHLRVSFVYPYRWFYGDYNILYVNKEYSIALVSGSDARYLWLLARNPNISEAEKQDLLGIARARGFDTNKLIWPKTAQ